MYACLFVRVCVCVCVASAEAYDLFVLPTLIPISVPLTLELLQNHLLLLFYFYCCDCSITFFPRLQFENLRKLEIEFSYQRDIPHQQRELSCWHLSGSLSFSIVGALI